jgi:hypothetical protein
MWVKIKKADGERRFLSQKRHNGDFRAKKNSREEDKNSDSKERQRKNERSARI